MFAKGSDDNKLFLVKFEEITVNSWMVMVIKVITAITKEAHVLFPLPKFDSQFGEIEDGIRVIFLIEDINPFFRVGIGFNPAFLNGESGVIAGIPLHGLSAVYA